MKQLLRRLSYFFHRRRLERELIDEMAFHREMGEREGTGRVGNTLRLREEAREAWGWTWIDRLAQDVRYAGRTLRRSPAFSSAAVLMLAIGIGVNIAAFGFVNAAFLKPLPVRDPATLLRFERRAPDRYASEVAYPEVAFVRDYATTLSAVIAVAPARLSLEGTAQRVNVQFVTTNFFSELGAGARFGRLLTYEDEREDSTAAVVISHPFWLRQFASDPAIVGRVLTLNHRSAVIVGIASPTFGGLTLDDPDIWIPLTRHPQFVVGSRLLTSFADDEGVRMWGRRRADATATAVETELASLLVALRQQRPADVWERERLVSEPGGRPGRGGGSGRGTGAPPRSRVGAVVGMIGALAVLILAVACGNLGSLLLARGVSRAREMQIRISVGAGAARLVRQLLTESIVLAACGSIVGLAVGQVLLTGVMSAAGAPRWLDMTPDWRVAVFTVGISAFATMLFGFAPAVQVARQRRHSTWIRHLLIGAQIAASCVLLIVSGLLVRALDRMTSTNPGFAYQQVVAVNPDLAAHSYSPERAEHYLLTLRDRLQSLAGVEAVSFATTPPLGRKKTVLSVNVDGRRVDVHVNHVDPTYLGTLSIPLRRGRAFGAGEARTMIVSESLGHALWPGDDPIGKTLDGRTIIGIAGNARQTALQDPDAVEGYLPMERDVWPAATVLVKTATTPEDFVLPIAGLTKALDADVFAEVEMLKTAFARKHDEAEVTAAGVSLLGMGALLLACAGIGGLVSYLVAQRTKEIGIRLALGASDTHVLTSVLRQLATPIGAGVIIGTAAAATLSQLLRRELYGISSLDPATYAAAIVIFGVTVAGAAWWPARRALRVDPLHALRVE
jgi:predicted permease